MTEYTNHHALSLAEPPFVQDATLSLSGVLRTAMERIGHRKMHFVLDAPRDEAVRARLPALSVYLHNIEPSRDEGPDVFRLHYLVSAWASSPTEEQVLYSAVLRALLLKPTIEGDELAGESFDGQGVVLPLMLSSRLSDDELSRFWSAVGQPPRPTIQCWISVAALRPEDVATSEAPRVREREIRIARKRSLS